MSVNQEATRPGRTIEKGMLFPDRKACTTYIHHLALASGKRAVIDKSKSSGKNIRFVCNSKTPCSFEIRVLNVHDLSTGDYESQFKKLGSLLQRYCEVNPSAHFSFEIKGNGEFRPLNAFSQPEKLYEACDKCYLVDSYIKGYGSADNGILLVLDTDIVEEDVKPPNRNHTEKKRVFM
ncbi:hypothetical protein P43SY_010527 [Pythium insidiosum]|uniref:Uncharacterized protein n=1 Tax=Pythium insidiosum TaxID=114742 RepID=A0AAD5Q5Z3_PYTIN|nr:hypothetical protein P43SY_010527 [Pythium insidiosum]